MCRCIIWGLYTIVPILNSYYYYKSQKTPPVKFSHIYYYFYYLTSLVNTSPDLGSRGCRNWGELTKRLVYKEGDVLGSR